MSSSALQSHTGLSCELHRNVRCLLPDMYADLILLCSVSPDPALLKSKPASYVTGYFQWQGQDQPWKTPTLCGWIWPHEPREALGYKAVHHCPEGSYCAPLHMASRAEGGGGVFLDSGTFTTHSKTVPMFCCLCLFANYHTLFYFYFTSPNLLESGL